MDELIRGCEDLQAHLQAGRLDAAAQWLRQATRSVEVASAVEQRQHDELVSAARFLQQHTQQREGATPASATATRNADGDEDHDDDVPLHVLLGSEAREGDSEAAADDDDVPLHVLLRDTLGDPERPDDHVDEEFDDGDDVPLEHRTSGQLTSTILALTAVDLGRNEDSVPFSAVQDAIDAAKSTQDLSTVVEEEVQTQTVAGSISEAALPPTSPGVGVVHPRADADSDTATPVRALAETSDTGAGASGNGGKSGTTNGRGGKQGGASTGGGSKGSVAGVRSLASFGFAKQLVERPPASKPDDDALIQPFFHQGDRTVPPHLQLWGPVPAASTECGEELPCSTPPVGNTNALLTPTAPDHHVAASVTWQERAQALCVPGGLRKLWNRNDVDVAGMGAPTGFDAEAVLVHWDHENYTNSELRPSFLGTWNSAFDPRALARPDDATWKEYSKSNGPRPAFELPRVAALDYEHDSGDDWDSEGSGTDVGADEAMSDVDDELDSDDREFLADEDDFSDEEQREEHRILQSEINELKLRSKRRAVELVPSFEGVYDGEALKDHPFQLADRFVFASNQEEESFGSGLAYMRVARAVLEESNLPIPPELMTQQERQVAAAKESARSAAVTGDTAKKSRVKRTAAPVVASAEGDGAVPPAGAKRVRSTKPTSTATRPMKTIDAMMANHKNTPAEKPPALQPALPSNRGADIVAEVVPPIE